MELSRCIAYVQLMYATLCNTWNSGGHGMIQRSFNRSVDGTYGALGNWWLVREVNVHIVETTWA
jgi:hypothetical protein